MERSVGSKKSVYGMLMTVLFYTTGFICALRTAAWLAMYTLIPAISHIIALYYRPSSSSSNPTPPSPATGGAGLVSNAGAGAEDIAGLLFKLVHTAAGHDLLVPVPASMYQISGAVAESAPLRRALVQLALLSSLIGAGGVAAYYYSLRRPLAWTWGKSMSAALQRWRHGPSRRAASDTDSSTTESRCSKTRLNPAAPAFTPSSSSPSPSPSPAPVPLVDSPPQLHRLDPTARTFAPRGCATPPSPADSTDSVGPATPSPSCIPSAFALAAARVARAAGTGMGRSVSAGVRLPVGVGKMRVVRPEEVVAGERRAGEVFVFF
ncbi:hypothetical protein EDB92DRAFT_512555 [Lactarius akahatsu]|uniref:Uncharacterized protein n=1 Tax=Lactarius akahatsu TaxID=416441 RepID=A0AAD4QBF2_9AGAM|nr:hypothetical protein EDB92DRAFT_512555 [Lactarius akahatsu]